MAKNRAYRRAKEKIAQALRTGAKELDLRPGWGAKASEKLTGLSESLGQLTQLRYLYLSGNQLTTLPESLGQLTQLQHLDLGRNQLTAFPESLGQLTQLQHLDLGRNQLTVLPESLGQLTQLQHLDLENNQLTTLPESLGQLTQLRYLHLSGNQLTTLPESLGQLTQLRRLDLAGNQLTTLPESLGQLMQLHFLNLDSNQLTTLPASLQRLTKLEELFLHGNPGLGIPDEILGADWPDSSFDPESVADPAKILDYYFSILNDQGTELRELKLLVVGRGGAGKTSLVRRLNGEPLDPGESETHGINIRPLNLGCADGPVNARVWDFGGQHVLHAMHEFFLTARSLYLLVLGEREDMAERDAAYWLQLIRSYAGDAPVVVALNKNKGRAREMDRESLERQYGPILAWVPTECADGFDSTIQNLRAALTQAADRMPGVRDKFPAKWWQIKQWLENMREPYLDFAAYQQKCAELGEQDPDAQAKLAAWLNDLGIAINYAEDERLYDTTVLRPDWLANGIYAILRANDPHHEKPLAPDAILTVGRLGPIYAGAQRLGMFGSSGKKSGLYHWFASLFSALRTHGVKPSPYPEQKWPFMLQLMNLFQLAFPLDDAGKELLVPTLLPLEPPADCAEPEDPDRTRLRYEFAVVPGPLLPKLLVRTFALIDAKRRWRRGAILKYGGAHARVWTTQDERWVRITAVGNQDDRGELLTMLRITLRELFAGYKNLQTSEQWEHHGKWVPRGTLEEFGVLEPERNPAEAA